MEPAPEWQNGWTCLCGGHKVVRVEARTWPGMNKHGGVGLIKKRNEDGTFNVRMVLGGADNHVDRCYISCVDEGGQDKRESKQTELFAPPVEPRAAKRHKPAAQVLPTLTSPPPPFPKYTARIPKSLALPFNKVVINTPPAEDLMPVPKKQAIDDVQKGVQPQFRRPLAPLDLQSPAPVAARANAPSPCPENSPEEKPTDYSPPATDMRYESFLAVLSNQMQEVEIQLEVQDLYSVCEREGFDAAEVDSYLDRVEGDNLAMLSGDRAFLYKV